MARHIKDLGLDGTQAYLVWCREVGVPATLEKSGDQRVRERALAASHAAAIESRTRLHRNPRKFLAAVCSGEIDPARIDRPGWREVAAAIGQEKGNAEDRKSLSEFLLLVERASDLVFESTTIARQAKLYIEGLIRLHQRKGQWLRDPRDWRPARHNTARQFSSLLRYLLARYEVPVFLDEAWLRNDRGAHRFRDWFIHIGRGHNIRTAKTPYPMTKMIAHHFVNAPHNVSIEGALMLADIKSLGGGPRLAASLMATRLGQSIEKDADRRAFWLSVYRFFIANPMLDLRHAGPIVDFLSYQKFETQEVMVGPGQVEIRPPPQPNLSMSRRAPESLLRQVENWHGELRVQRASDKRFWKASRISSFNARTGPADRPEDQVHWTVSELLSGQDLIDEGRRMKHCVATYAESCIRGSISIWSLKQRRGVQDRSDLLLTIAIDAKRNMVEARGFRNRWPTAQEKGVLEAWMRKAELKPGPYLFGW